MALGANKTSPKRRITRMRTENYSEEQPHLIILDLGLPAGDGFAVLKNLQEYPALSVIPVIVLTARDPEGNEKRTLESGAIAFFQKPADNEELLGVIRASLQAGLGWGGGLPS